VNHCFTEFGIDYPAILSLRDFGLLHESDSLTFTIGSDRPVAYHLYNGVALEMTAPTSPSLKGKAFPVLVLTVAGCQLKALMRPDPDERFLKLLRRTLNGYGIVIRRGSLVEKDGTTVQVFSDIPFPEDPAPPAAVNPPSQA